MIYIGIHCLCYTVVQVLRSIYIMCIDWMVEWCHRLNGHECEQAPGDSEGQGGLACCSPWGHKELDTTERPNNNMSCVHHDSITQNSFTALKSQIQLLTPPSPQLLATDDLCTVMTILPFGECYIVGITQ